MYTGKDGTEWTHDLPSNAPDDAPIRYPPQNFDLGPRIKDNFQHLDSMLSFFNYFFDFIIITKLVEYTNMRIKYENRRKNKNNACLTYDELRGFIGLLILLGVTHKNSVEVAEIWSEESANHFFMATATMSRDRYVKFLWISHYLKKE